MLWRKYLAGIWSILVVSTAVVASEIKPMTPSNNSIRILENFWPKANVDPVTLQTAGDWTILQNLYSGLVEMGSAKTARPALAESWVRSPDGRNWKFKLRKNLKWSDGSVMTPADILESLKRAIKGTTHTQMHTYVDEVLINSNEEIEFHLKASPENFLINLAFIDLSITHPRAYSAGKFSWDAPVSGAFTVKSVLTDRIELKANPNYWDARPKRPELVELVRGAGGPGDVATLLTQQFDASQLSPGTIGHSSQLDELEKKYDVFTGATDFLFCLGFSKKRTQEGQLPLGLRRFLLKWVTQEFWKGDAKNRLRATGLRPEGSKGALSKAEAAKHIENIKDQLPIKNGSVGLTLELLISERHRKRFGVNEVIRALNDAGVTIKEKVVANQELADQFQKGDFDLSIQYLGASEADPDSAWRIYNEKYLAEAAATNDELSMAQQEKNPQARDRLYQSFESRLLDRALLIPLRNEVSFIVSSQKVMMDPKTASDWGLQVFKLDLR